MRLHGNSTENNTSGNVLRLIGCEIRLSAPCGRVIGARLRKPGEKRNLRSSLADLLGYTEVPMRIRIQRHIRNFATGMGSVLVLWPEDRQTEIGKRVLNRSDREALQTDWQNVGGQIRLAYRTRRAELSTHGKQE